MYHLAAYLLLSIKALIQVAGVLSRTSGQYAVLTQCNTQHDSPLLPPCQLHLLLSNMSASSYIDILRDDIYVHNFDDHDCSWPPAVAQYTQRVLDALRLPSWIISVGQVYIIHSIRDLFSIIYRVPILTSRIAHVHCSASYAHMTVMFPLILPSLTMTCTDASRQPSESRSATVLHSAMLSI